MANIKWEKGSSTQPLSLCATNNANTKGGSNVYMYVSEYMNEAEKKKKKKKKKKKNGRI